jgi:hypothetical protein
MDWDPATKAYVERRIQGEAGLEHGVDGAKESAGDGNEGNAFALALSGAPVQVSPVDTEMTDSSYSQHLDKAPDVAIADA